MSCSILFVKDVKNFFLYKNHIIIDIVSNNKTM